MQVEENDLAWSSRSRPPFGHVVNFDRADGVRDVVLLLALKYPIAAGKHHS